MKQCDGFEEGYGRRERKREQHRRYYAKTAFKYDRRPWTPDEDQLVMAHMVPDSRLSAVIRRSLKAISNRRWRLVRAERENGKGTP